MKQIKKFRLFHLKFIIFSFVLILMLSPAICAELFSDYKSQPLTNNEIVLHESPAVATYKKNVHVVWNCWPDEFNCSIYYKRSLDNGQTWSEPLILSVNHNRGIYPEIGLNGEIVHVIWKDYRDENPEIYYARSLDNGQNWSEPRRLTFDCARKNNIYDLNIVVENSFVYVVWKDYKSGSSEIFLMKSNDNGDSWSESIRLTFDYNPSYFPHLAINDGELFIAYEDRGVFYNIGFLKSQDGGLSWSELKIITSSESSSEKPYLLFNKGILYLVWQEEFFENRELFFKKSLDYGESWTDVKQITFDNTKSINPRLFVLENQLVLIYQKYVNKSFFIHYKTSSDFGETWSKDKQLVENEGSYTIDHSIQGNNLHIVWQDFHEGAWSDIWHLGNYNCTIISDQVIDNTIVKNNSPGFEFIFVIISFLVIVFIIRLKKGDKK